MPKITDKDTLSQIRSGIENEYLPWPFLVMNDEFLPGQGEEILAQTLEDLQGAGYGGVFIHPRPGLACDYLGERWFELVRFILDRCKALGLEVGIYDENSYPSGFAGGYVPARAPDTVVRYLAPVEGVGPTPLPENYICLYARVEDGSRARVERTAVGETTHWVAFVPKYMEPSAWHAGFSYTSLLDPETTPIFLETTHQRYREELNDEQWSALKAIFTDEPHLPAEQHGSWSQGLHFSPWIRTQFEAIHGYDVTERWGDLYWQSETASATRFDFYETLHQLWVKHWALPLAAWCRKHELPLTGHYLEHDWPCPYATPGHMHLLKYLDYPGTDLLENFLLEGHPDGDPQNLGATEPGREPQALYYLKQVQSVANQLGKERVMCEIWGAGGNDSSPADWLRIARFAAVHGVNLFVPHYTPATIRGSRKTDHPQFFSRHHPAFHYLKPMNEELGRLSRWACKGSVANRVLLLDPQTTGYCEASKSDCLGIERHADAILRPEFILETQKSFSQLRKSTTHLAEGMSERCVDFDIGDEYVIEEDAAVREACLQVGVQKYQCIILPPDLRNLRRSTLVLLKEFLEAGGRILACRPEQPLVDGRPADWPVLLSAGANQALWLDDVSDLLEAVCEAVPPRISSDQPFPAGWAHQRRVLQDRVEYLVVNSGPAAFSGRVHLEDGEMTAVTDPANGCTWTALGGSINIPATGALILGIGKIDQIVSPPNTEITSTEGEPMAVSLESTEAASENIWVLDNCAPQLDAKQHPVESVYTACGRYWRAAGMASNGWHMLVQFQNSLQKRVSQYARNVKSSFTYPFQIGEGVDPSTWEIAVESPEIWEVELNGVVIDFAQSRSWRDAHIRRISTEGLLQHGENQLVLKSSTFQAMQEIDQIYLFGDFSLVSTDQGFRAEVPRALELGSWKYMGRPFFDESVVYEFAPSGPAAKEIMVQLNEDQWSGSVVELISGDYRKVCYGGAIKERIPLDASQRFQLRVVGLPQNSFGPFRLAKPRAKSAWSIQWFSAEDESAPFAGDRYNLLDLGLLALPSCFRCK